MDGNITIPSTQHNISRYESLKDYIIKYLSTSYESLQRYPRDEPYIVVLMLELLYSMLRLGFIKKFEDINQILIYVKKLLLFDRSKLDTSQQEAVSEALNGLMQNPPKDDENIQEAKSAPKKGDAIDQCIADAKRTICLILKYILELQNDIRCQIFCSKLKILLSDNDQSSLDRTMQIGGKAHSEKSGTSAPSTLKNKNASEKYSENLNDMSIRQGLLDDDEESKSGIESGLDEKLIKLVNKVLDEDTSIKFSKTENLNLLLLSVTDTHDTSLITELLDMLNKIHTNKTRLRNTLIALQFITEEHTKDYYSSKKLFDSLVELFQSKEKWYGDTNGSETEKIENGI
jgi:hypothetical protein